MFVSLDICFFYEGFLLGMLVMGLFCKRFEWFKMWGKIELKDVYRKFKEDIKKEKVWEGIRFGNEFNLEFVKYVLFIREDYKVLFVVEIFFSRIWMLIDYGLILLIVLLRI